MDTGEVRNHLQKLVDQGMSQLAIARQARTSEQTVHEIVRGRRKSVGSDLAKRLRRVEFDPAFGPKGWDATEDRIMLEALAWQGYDDSAIAAGAGIDQRTVRKIMSGQVVVKYGTHRQIKRFYARHWAFYGGNDEVRRQAMTLGYNPPAEWDGKPITHGTLRTYQRGCHCEDCRAAKARSEAQYEMRRLRGIDNGTTDAGPARLHVQKLLGEDMPLGAIAANADVSRHYLQRLVYGADEQVTQKIPRNVAERIRNVKYDPAFLKTGLRHPAGTERRLRGLVLMRWEPASIAIGTNLEERLLERIIAGQARHITATVYERVRRFYDANWNRDGGSAAARERAIRERFAPPSAWSEATIDNPAARPCGVDQRIYKEADS